MHRKLWDACILLHGITSILTAEPFASIQKEGNTVVTDGVHGNFPRVSLIFKFAF